MINKSFGRHSSLNESISECDPPTLSVVIPAYNVEKYIAECLVSVLEQTKESRGIDVIVVIDGATDDTRNIAREIAARHSVHNVQIIEQENQGLSGARNTGLKLAKTDYVTFLDGDDYWLPGYLDAVFNALHSLKPDIVEYDALEVDEQGNFLAELKISSGTAAECCYADKESFLKIFRCYSWARVYRLALFSKHQFPVGRRFEDTLTTPWLYWECKSAISLGLPLIGYRQRDGSILRSPTKDDVRDLNYALQAALAMWRRSQDSYWQKVAMRILQQACSRAVKLPLHHWLAALKMAKLNSHDLIAGPGFIRRIQVRHTIVYAILLYIKRNTFDLYRTFGAHKQPRPARTKISAER